jgi:hypothetical protein
LKAERHLHGYPKRYQKSICIRSSGPFRYTVPRVEYKIANLLLSQSEIAFALSQWHACKSGRQQFDSSEPSQRQASNQIEAEHGKLFPTHFIINSIQYTNPRTFSNTTVLLKSHGIIVVVEEIDLTQGISVKGTRSFRLEHMIDTREGKQDLDGVVDKVGYSEATSRMHTPLSVDFLHSLVFGSPDPETISGPLPHPDTHGRPDVISPREGRDIRGLVKKVYGPEGLRLSTAVMGGGTGTTTTSRPA